MYSYMASDIWLRTIQIAREETRCHHMGHSFRLAARVLLYALSHRQNSTYHGLCYTSRGALAGMRNSSMGPPHEGSIRRPIAPWANALTMELHLAPLVKKKKGNVFYLTTYLTHFIYSYMVSDIGYSTAQTVKEKIHCYIYMGYSFCLTARVLLYAPSHRWDSTHHVHCCTIRGALAGI